MYRFLHDLLSDKKGGEIFTLFGFWHFFYIALTLIAIITIMCLLRKMNDTAREKVIFKLIGLAFGLYIADFFLMPLAYGNIDIEKLPFHGCTAMCVMCYLSHRVGFLQKYHLSFVMLGFISNLAYLICPAGVMWYEVHPLSYRVIQTLLFHSVMTVYGTISLLTHRGRFDARTICRDVSVILGMTFWALVGNYTYSGTADGYSYIFNWFFVVRDPFNVIPEAISRLLMPALNVLLFSAVAILLRWLLRRRELVRS